MHLGVDTQCLLEVTLFAFDALDRRRERVRMAGRQEDETDEGEAGEIYCIWVCRVDCVEIS